MDQRQTGGNRQSHVVHQALWGSACATIGAVQGDEIWSRPDAAQLDGIAKIVQPFRLAHDELDACRFTRG